ncbi:hypothetical protein, partial [Actinotalea ferrariae]|uniref:hypothetical protein n=1 Tax=Actinotalea ferrariae TaxID=1386098 RepID=UPI0005564B11
DRTARLVAARDACTGTVAVLERLVDLERELPARRTALATATAAVQGLDVELHELRDRQSERPGRRAALEADLAAAREAAEGLVAAQQAVALAEERLAAADD